MADSTTQPLKGILKAPTESFPVPANSIAAVPQLDQHEVKEILRMEQQIFDDTMLLVDFPRGQPPEFTAAHPDPADVAAFTRKVIHFKPDEFDGLVQERNAEKKCGYVLCSNKNRTYDRGQKVLVNKNLASFNVMSGEELSKWCSDHCLRRALYIKVQLREVLRASIQLIDEADLGTRPKVSSHPSRAETPRASEDSKTIAEAAAKKKQDSAALAHERGSPRRTIPSKSMTLTIREKTPQTAPTAPVSQGMDDHQNIEGYAVSGSGTTRHSEVDDAEQRPHKLTDEEALALFKAEPASDSED